MTAKQYFTTPIYYVNGLPHIGHCYTGLLTDTWARLATMQGYDVKMQTGTDEHGSKVEQSAKTLGVDTLDFCNHVSAQFRELMIKTNLCCCYDRFDAGYNFYKTNNQAFGGGKNFIRTTEEKHKKSVTSLWQKLDQNGWIYKDTYKGWYALRDEAFYDESEIVNGKAPSGAPVEWREEEAYFFKLSHFSDILVNFYNTIGKTNIPSFARQEMVSFIKSGLKDLCISRVNLNWGIRVPGDEKHAIYVWLDALQNYVSALGDERQEWWDGVYKKTHVIGKDIARFHTVYWPSFLIGTEYSCSNLPDLANTENATKIIQIVPNFIVHGWWLNNGEKMSKSLNNSLDPYKEMGFIKQSIDPNITDIKNAQELSLDYFRYFLIKAMPAGSDGNYSRDFLTSTVNSDLVNNIGNLANRVFSLVYKNCQQGILLKKVAIKEVAVQEFEQTDREIDLSQTGLSTCFGDLGHIVSLALKHASLSNAIIDKAAPWAMIKNQQHQEFYQFMLPRLADVYQVAIFIRPIVPFIAESILDYMQISPNKRLLALAKRENAFSVIFDTINNANFLGFGASKKEGSGEWCFGTEPNPPYPMVPRLKTNKTPEDT